MLRTIQRFVLCTLLFILFVLAPNSLLACSFICPQPDKIKLVLPNEKLESSDAVFLGTLIDYKAEPVPVKKKPKKEPFEGIECIFSLEDSMCFSPLKIHTYTFEVHKAWKGAVGNTLSLTQISSYQVYDYGCGTPNVVLDSYSRIFEKNKHYLVYADRDKSDNQLHPRWRSTKPVELAIVEMMFLDAAKNNLSVASVAKQLPEVLRSSSTWPVTRAEAIMWLRLAPSQMSTEGRKKLFIEALISNHESLRKMEIKPVEGKDFEGLPGYQRHLNEDDTNIITAVALALGSEEFKGHSDIIPALIYLLNGEADHRVNVAAAVSLKRLGFKNKKIEKRIYEVLKYGLEHSKRGTRLQILTYNALYEIKNPESEIITLEQIKKNLTHDPRNEQARFLNKLIRIQKVSLAKNNE